MTWDDARDWAWHLFNDPLRDNPWSVVALVVIVVAVPAAWVTADRWVRHMWRRRREHAMTDYERAADTIDTAREDQPTAGARPAYMSDAEPAVFTEPGVGDPDPVTDSGVHALGDLTDVANLHRVGCRTCGGQGFTLMSTRELLRDSVALIPDGGGDVVVKEFYTRLLKKAKGLTYLFPPDLLTAATADPNSRGARQRDRLYKALEALATMYDPDDRAGMEKLDTALAAFGRSHATFNRDDGPVRGATLDEYAAVKATLLETLQALTGAAWSTAFTSAWSEAYDYAAATMMYEQHRSRFMATPRQPRESS